MRRKEEIEKSIKQLHEVCDIASRAGKDERELHNGYWNTEYQIAWLLQDISETLAIICDELGERRE